MTLSRRRVLSEVLNRYEDEPSAESTSRNVNEQRREEESSGDEGPLVVPTEDDRISDFVRTLRPRPQ